MHVAYALTIQAQRRQRISAAEDIVPGIEEQPDRLAGDLHQPVDLLFRLHHGPDVMVVREPETPPPEILGDLRQALAEPRPLVEAERGSPRARHRALSVDAAGLLREHHDAAAHLLQQLDVSLHRLDLFPRRASLQVGTVPAGDEAQAVADEEWAKLGRVARELATELDAVVSRRASLLQADLERRVVA